MTAIAVVRWMATRDPKQDVMSAQSGDKETPPIVPGRMDKLVTNLIKLGGLVFAGNELLIRSEIRPGALAIAAFAMGGAVITEQIIEKVFR